MLTRLISTAMMSLAISACTTTQTEGQCVGTNCEAQSEDATRLTAVPGVLVGMTREEVVSVLGDEFYSYSPEGLPPVVDSFPYTENGKRKHIYVRYHRGLVRYAVPGFDWPYRVK